MIINHNMASLNTYNKLSANNAQTSKALEKLSSGLRINRAGDDAAGLAISEKMRGQIRGLDQASRNAQDATSMLNTAEGNLSETQSILQRMKELATQASNDTNVGVDRGEIQKEINQLTSEVNRIGNTTEFNTQKLLNGANTQISPVAVTTTTAGAAKGAMSAISTLTTAVVGAQAKYEVNIKADAALATTDHLTFDLNSDGNVDVDITGADTVANVVTALSANSTFSAAWTASTAADGKLTITAKANQAYDGVEGNHLLVAGSGYNSVVGTTIQTMGQTEVRGKYSISIDTALAQGGDSITFRIGAAGATLAVTGADLGVGASKEDQATALAAFVNNDVTFKAQYKATAVGKDIIFEDLATKADPTKDVRISTPLTSTAVTGQYNFKVTSMVESGGKYTIDGHDIRVTTDATDVGLKNGTAMLVGASVDEQATNLVAAIGLNSDIRANYTSAVNATVTNQVDLTQASTKETSVAPVVSSADKSGVFTATFQIGANMGQSMTIDINDMRSAALKIAGDTAGGKASVEGAVFTAAKTVNNGTDSTNVEYALDVSDYKKATAAIKVLSNAIESVSAERSKIGAYTNRLEHTVNNLTTSSENMTAAESRIRDVDMAKEMMNFQKNNILAQAAQAMLAQANQQPQGVLQLLR